jgi:transcription initiation factor TFIIIB Brf1 subunit/transcription initiation factor TFIIB
MINSLLTELHHKKCHSCQAEDLISDHSTGDIVCRSCGTVHGDRFVSDEAEWRDYEDRQGTDGSRSSMLVVAEDEMEHRSFSGGTKEDRDLLNRLQSSQYTKRELKMFDSFSNLEQLTFKLGLSDTLTVSFPFMREWEEGMVPVREQSKYWIHILCTD